MESHILGFDGEHTTSRNWSSGGFFSDASLPPPCDSDDWTDLESTDNTAGRYIAAMPDLFSASFSYLISFEIVVRPIGSPTSNFTTTIVQPLTGESATTTFGCRLYEFILYTLIGGLICFLGLCGNAICVGVFWPDRNKSSTVFLMLSLAVVDSSVLLTWTWLPAVVAYFRFQYSLVAIYRFLPYAQVYIYPLCTLTHTITTWVTVLLTFHRFLAVCRPFYAKRYATTSAIARWQLLSVLILSTAFNVPRFIENRITYLKVNGTAGGGNNTSLWRIPIAVRRQFASRDLYDSVYLVGIYYVIIYAAPLTLLLILTFRLIKALNVAKAKRQEMTSSKQSNTSMAHIELTYSLVVVVGIFVVCQLFNPIRRILADIATSFSSSPVEEEEDDEHSDKDSGPRSAAVVQYRSHNQLGHYEQCGSFYFYYAPIVVVMVALNSSVNCVVYAACNRKFRAKVIRLLTCRRGHKVTPASVLQGPLRQCSSVAANVSGMPPLQQRLSFAPPPNLIEKSDGCGDAIALPVSSDSSVVNEMTEATASGATL